MGLMQNMLIIYMFISLGLYLTTFGDSGINLGVDGLPDILHVDRFVDVNEGGNPDFNSSEGIMNKLPQSAGSGGISVGGVISFITDGLGLVFSIILLLVNLVTMPLQMFLSVAGMPVELTYLVAIPMGIMMVIGIIFFIRGFKG